MNGRAPERRRDAPTHPHVKIPALLHHTALTLRRREAPSRRVGSHATPMIHASRRSLRELLSMRLTLRIQPDTRHVGLHSVGGQRIVVDALVLDGEEQR